MSLGSDTSVVNGQRVSTPVASQYSPLSYGVQTSGVPQVSPTAPPFIGGGGSTSAASAVEGVGGYGTAGNNQAMTAIAAANPYSGKVSPVWWAVGSLVIGLFLLQVIHWRHTTLESFDERGTAGPVSEEAREAA